MHPMRPMQAPILALLRALVVSSVHADAIHKWVDPLFCSFVFFAVLNGMVGTTKSPRIFYL